MTDLYNKSIRKAAKSVGAVYVDLEKMARKTIAAGGWKLP